MHKKLIPIYNKELVQMSKIMVHDEKEECEIGDEVLIRQSRPYSKRKHHILWQVLKKNPAIDFLKANPQLIPQLNISGTLEKTTKTKTTRDSKPTPATQQQQQKSMEELD